ncbi:ketosteroid isomerase-related protein [Agrobacterium tumefaciens]|uniref:Ketosteroid isomerase-related protein n=1 Tax=Agrobacterium tumefaciens TaxID=358 RepID=A0A0D0KYE7_AGRTU|nr:ketosteroid isomerase-related protein [Agrobacterium tumefaciens]
MDMPQIVKNYFGADSHSDIDALLKTFVVDAVVEDENARHQGDVAIRQWWLAAKKATQYLAEPVESKVEGDKALVRARVSGQFAGSPVMLTHAFTVRDDKIVRLEIHS